MPIRSNNLCVVDFETTGVDPNTCYPVEIAAKIYNERSLEPIPEAEFNQLCRPPKTHTWDVMKTQEITGIKPEEVENASPINVIYPKFVDWLLKYNAEGNLWTALVFCGQNVSLYDMIIHNRMMDEFCPKISKEKVFRNRYVDLMDIMYLWGSNSKELKGYSLSELRRFMGLPLDKQHRALVDVSHTGLIITRFLKLHRELSKIYIPQMENCFKSQV